jgi:hypothetical protein
MSVGRKYFLLLWISLLQSCLRQINPVIIVHADQLAQGRSAVIVTPRVVHDSPRTSTLFRSSWAASKTVPHINNGMSRRSGAIGGGFLIENSVSVVE